MCTVPCLYRACLYSLPHSDTWICYNLFSCSLFQEIPCSVIINKLLQVSVFRFLYDTHFQHCWPNTNQPKSIIGVYTKTMLSFIKKISQNSSKVITILYISAITNDRSPMPQPQHLVSSGSVLWFIWFGFEAQHWESWWLSEDYKFGEEVEASLASFILVMRLDLTRIKRLFECERSRRRRLLQNCKQGMPP